ncbi:unnamed protein product [Hymenolepis diminuta]|uniref:BTB domain-containing protein n=1 Tax=Hymenolepis diminuta TaxID=6216 RepID=A0A564YJU3_HYMDI|nr:unnamed protein product [Hymenolepis diminuta]
MEAIQSADKTLFMYSSSVQDKIFDFYKEGKLTDVTWIVGSDEERIDAHSSICALSNRLKELILAHPSDKKKKLIRVPPSLTNSADELKSLLLLAYTGNLEESRSIIGYLELCERFDMPLGHAVCSRALPKFFAKTLLQPNIDVNQQKALRQIFIEAFEKTTSTEVHQAVLNVFRMHPLLFNDPSCLSNIPLDWILKVIKEKSLWMQSTGGYVYFGRSYITEVNQLLNNFFAVHDVNPIPVEFNSGDSMLAPLCMKDLDTQPFGFHSFAYDYNYSELPGSKNSYDKHPPGQWKVCALTGHVSRSWDGRQVLAGLDITYQNLITGRKEEVLWGHENDRLYTKHTIQVPEDDVITGAIINSGWLIDKLVFTTLRGMHMDALGGSDGGNRTVVEPSNFWRDSKPSVHNSILVAFHGIQYINIKSQGQILINRVTFHFSCVNEKAVLKLNQDEGEFAIEILRSKRILL